MKDLRANPGPRPAGSPATAIIAHHRIMQLRARIGSGTYPVRPALVADAILALGPADPHHGVRANPLTGG